MRIAAALAFKCIIIQISVNSNKNLKITTNFFYSNRKKFSCVEARFDV